MKGPVSTEQSSTGIDVVASHQHGVDVLAVGKPVGDKQRLIGID